MREMKDSGIGWLKQIPASWKMVLLSSVVKERKHKNAGMPENNLLSLSYGNVIRKNINTTDGLLPESFESYNIVEEGDVVLRLTDLQNDHMSLRTGLVKERGIITSAYITLISDTKYYLPQYLHYQLHAFDICKGFYGMGAGVRQGLNFDGVKKIGLVLPTIDEQKKIVTYLYRRCATIDALIANQQQQIEKLIQYKQAVITEAVTRGLDPNAQMKDSGVEWIGLIPSHWHMQKLKTYTAMVTPMRDKPEDLDGPIPWIRIEDFDGQYIYESKDHLGVSMETVKAMNLKIYPVNSILCTSSCILGKCAIVGRELVSNQRFIDIIPDEHWSSTFLYYLMISNAERLNTLSTGAMQANLSRVSFEQLMVQYPELDEQKSIAAYLDTKCAQIDALIAVKQQKANKLTQYKKSLIYEVVTGKREIG